MTTSPSFRALCADLTPEHTSRRTEGDLHPEVREAYRYVDSVVATADFEHPLAWCGWALREAFLAGCTHARAALADEPAVPAPPADGEVAELAAEIRHFLAGYQKIRGLDPEHIYFIHRGDKMEAHITVSRLTRAAELLQRQALVPVSVRERPWEREGWCDAQGNCWLGGNALDGRTPTWVYAPFAWAERFQDVHRILLPAHALPLPEASE